MGRGALAAYRCRSTPVAREGRMLSEPPTHFLRDPLERMAAIVELADDAIYDVTLEGMVLHWNIAAERLFGYTRDEIAGRSVTVLIPADRQGEESDILDRVRRGELVKHYETIRRSKNGDAIYVSISVTPMRDAAGVIVGATKIARDQTRQTAAERALREREERMRAIVETASDAIITIDEHGIIDSLNPAAEEMFGYPAAELLGQNVSRIMPQPYCDQHDEYLRRYRQTGMAAIIGIGRDVTAVRRDGSLVPVHLAVNEVRLASRLMFTAVLHDLTNRRRLEKLVAEASAREQQRIGQDLHDGLGQQLAGMSFFCKSLATRLEAKSLPEAADARRMGELITEALIQARGLARGLNPVMSNQNGLMAALEHLAAYAQNTFSVPCRFTCEKPVFLDDTTFATHVYRIAQEAVTNALKHAMPSQVEIDLKQDANDVTLTITDDGQGIAADACPAGRAGIGREIMRSRAAFIGGTLQIAPGPAGGTVVRCTFPQPVHPEVHP
ncbi:MAG: putative signal transduction histidine kinase [Phycisphaerales bacterium]|nr:putative signal transduction histidine kinase [Phycisphaerales bacterium]